MLPPMKSILVTVLLFALGAGALVFLKQRRDNGRATATAEAAAALAAERISRFGDEALDPAIEWRETGLGIKHTTLGEGAVVYPGVEVRFNYVGRLADGTVFDRSTKPLDGRIGQLVPGVSAGLQLVRIGGRATIYIPPRLGYGQARVGSLPENASLIFDVELLPR
jgi:FKBP-type peptidyl-prolyl cis-trans isomerase